MVIPSLPILKMAGFVETNIGSQLRSIQVGQGPEGGGLSEFIRQDYGTGDLQDTYILSYLTMSI